MSPRRKLSDARRQQILKAAVQVIAEKGLCDTGIKDVARRAGVTEISTQGNFVRFAPMELRESQQLRLAQW